ncbi:alpha/beta hydrolase-fold protein [Candidatus Pantoea multigeneris]|uniref:Esterase family protein n=1 Tax=Candidatus Pantoea multigeneris TaxID=2608357 RepID=A0ABX0RMJ0_9GAMM|nr:alpha/beta hydrolase-fold protein [Pantoea multigeneris]NIF24565.1 esterase family protein [Pantoea multigeneris]
MRNAPLLSSHDATARICQQLAARSVNDVAQFWQDVARVDVPLIAPNGPSEEVREVTFLWRSAASLQGVYVFLNRITDKQQVAKGMMSQIPGSDIWTLTLHLPATYRGTYTLTEIPLDTPSDVIAQLGGRHTPFVGQFDPLNKRAHINVRGQAQESILALDRAPEQAEWHDAPNAHRGMLVTSWQQVAGKQRRVRLYLPDVASSTPLGLLVLTDSEKWIDHVGVLGALDSAYDSGRIGATAVLGIDNLDDSDRATLLGGDPALVRELAQRLIPQVWADHPDRLWAGRSKTILAGQSLGGVTALLAALYAPEVFGCVLSHSPSLWWTPDKGRRPLMFSEKDASWVSEHVLARVPQTVRVQLCVGSLEGVMVPHVEQLYQRLQAAGVESDLTIYTGGHDFAWWRGALLDGLAALEKPL